MSRFIVFKCFFILTDATLRKHSTPVELGSVFGRRCCTVKTQQKVDVTQILQARQCLYPVPSFPKGSNRLRSLEVEVISAQWTMNQLVRILGFVLRFTDLLDCGHKGTNTVNNDCHNVVFMQHSTRRPTCAKKISSSALDHQQPRATRQEESLCSVFLPNRQSNSRQPCTSDQKKEFQCSW